MKIKLIVLFFMSTLSVQAAVKETVQEAELVDVVQCTGQCVLRYPWMVNYSPRVIKLGDVQSDYVEIKTSLVKAKNEAQSQLRRQCRQMANELGHSEWMVFVLSPDDKASLCQKLKIDELDLVPNYQGELPVKG